MKRFITFSLALAVVLVCQFDATAQLMKNDGATLTIESGAILFIEGGIENSNSGTINNQGVIELEGDFLNSATYTGTGDTVTFSGADNADLTSGGATIGTFIMNKDANKTVSLLDNAAVGTELDFAANDNHVVLGANDLRIGENASIQNYASDKFVVTDGNGQLWIDSVSSGETQTFPVGYAAGEYTPFDISVNSADGADHYGVRVQDSALIDGTSGAGVETDVVSASWVVEQGTPGTSDIDVEAFWFIGDETMNFDPANSAVVRYDISDAAWEGDADDFGASTGGSPDSRSNGAFDETGVFAVVSSGVNPTMTSNVELAVKVFLYGPYVNGTGLMGDELRDSNFIPVEEPYSVAPFNYAYKGLSNDGEIDDVSIFNTTGNDAIVDWVIVELRHETEDTVMFSASALIQRDGDVVALDGVSNLQVGGVPAGNYYVAIGHRNHHKVRSSSTLALSSSNTAYDFTTALGQAYDNPGVTTNDAMFAFADGNYGMLGGDANYDAKTSYIGGNNDRGAILLLLGGAGGVENDYMSEDVNMNAKVSYIGANNDRGSILLMLGSAGGVANAHVTN